MFVQLTVPDYILQCNLCQSHSTRFGSTRYPLAWSEHSPTEWNEKFAGHFYGSGNKCQTRGWRIHSLNNLAKRALAATSSLPLCPYLWIARTVVATQEMMVSVVNICSKLTLYFPLSITFCNDYSQQLIIIANSGGEGGSHVTDLVLYEHLLAVAKSARHIKLLGLLLI